MPCANLYALRNQFWTVRTQIAPNGDYRRTYTHYDNGTGLCLPVEKSHVVYVTGSFDDLGASPIFACGGRTYSDTIETITATVWSNTELALFIAAVSIQRTTTRIKN